MVEQGCERGEFLDATAPHIRTVVHLLLMGRRVQMLIQGPSHTKLCVTEIALPFPSIVCPVGSCVSCILVFAPFQLFGGDHPVCITLPDDAEDGFTVESPGVGTGAAFQMMSKTRGRGEAVVAKRAADGRAAVDLGVEVLPDGIISVTAPYRKRTKRSCYK